MVLGVLLHVRDFLGMSADGYRMASMGWSTGMLVGMALIVGGLALAARGLIPVGAFSRRPDGGVTSTTYQCRAMDGARLSRGHLWLLLVLLFALVIDVMKPATLGFVLPGLRAEYGIDRGEAAVLPFVALLGTTVGSLLWGSLGDRIGRRASILLATLFFVSTSVCGAMPYFQMNLVMCFLMGSSAGGMLPIVYALTAESVPARHRGWLVVLHGGLGAVGGYLAASGAAALLEPRFGWRILWFIGLPTGLLMLLLNRWIPESPRFLLAHGRVDEARVVMARYGVVVRSESVVDGPEVAERPSAAHELLRIPYLPHTLTLALYGLAWGLVNWGFLTFLPTLLDESGTGVADASRLLFFSAVLALPSTAAVAWLYGRWSSKKTMVICAAGTGGALVGLAAVQRLGGAVLVLMVVFLLASSGGVIAMLSPYAVEIYPTRLRGRASGLAAASSKAGGVIGPPLVIAVMAVGPGLPAVALATAAPMVLAATVLARYGIETRGRSLEELETETAKPFAGRVGGARPARPSR